MAHGSRWPSLRYPRIAIGVVAFAFVVGPLLLAGAGGWTGRRSFDSEFGSALGIVALGIFGLVLVLPTRIRVFERLGADAAVRLHRRLASGLLAVIAAHVIVVVLADPSRIRLFQFVGQPWRAQAAIGSTIAFLCLLLSSQVRRRLRLRYMRWRGLHVALAVAALTLAVAHTVGWHRYLMTGVGVLGLIGVAGTAATAVGWLRLGRPHRLGKKEYILERVIRERGGTATLELKADRHPGQSFRAGQFAWIKLADRRLSLDEHPFSYSSSARRPDRPSFTIRAYHGFSAAIQQLRPGTRLIVDGPHGGYRTSRRARGTALIANGIGITPMMSILRTAADVGDRRRFILIYGNRDLEAATFREELDALQNGPLELNVVHVLTNPRPTWAGLTGRITAEVLARTLPNDLRRWEFFLCGSGPAVDSSLVALQALDVPPERIHAERFVEV